MKSAAEAKSPRLSQRRASVLNQSFDWFEPRTVLGGERKDVVVFRIVQEGASFDAGARAARRELQRFNP